jgi:hypothetical protein
LLGGWWEVCRFLGWIRREEGAQVGRAYILYVFEIVGVLEGGNRLLKTLVSMVSRVLLITWVDKRRVDEMSRRRWN